MRQSEFKMRYDPELAKFTKHHIYGKGVKSKSFGLKMLGKKKKSTENIVKAIVAAAAARKEQSGKKAGDKVVKTLSKEKAPAKKVTFKNPTPAKKVLTRQQINNRVNQIMSWGKTI